jgi:hypothetical protein
MEEGRRKSKRLSYMAKFKREVIRYYIVWEDDVEDKDDNDWVESMDNNSVMSDDGKSDE